VDFLQPADVCRDQGCAGFDAAVIGINALSGWHCVAHRIVEIAAHINLKRALIALARQDIVTA